MHAEIPVLRIVNGLFYRAQLKKMSRLEREAIYAEGIKRLHEKIKLLKMHPQVKFSDFGNRRSFSAPWHEFVVARITEELPDQFMGTSNTKLAMEYNQMAIGTCAHELSMIFAALQFDGTNESLKKSFVTLHENWWEKYGHGLSIFLPDTFGTNYALSILPYDMIKDWKGSRIDSMDPIACGNLWIFEYQRRGIDPRQKMIIPSDGLDVPSMIKITQEFMNRIKVSHGIGTKLTNDLGLKQLSIVVKPHSANGKPCVKLSDNIAKAMGEPEAVEAYKKAVGYNVTENKACEV